MLLFLRSHFFLYSALFNLLSVKEESTWARRKFLSHHYGHIKIKENKISLFGVYIMTRKYFRKTLAQGANLCHIIMVTLKLKTTKYLCLVFISSLEKYFRKALDQWANLCHIIMVTWKLRTTKYLCLVIYIMNSSVVGFHHIFVSNTKK